MKKNMLLAAVFVCAAIFAGAQTMTIKVASLAPSRSPWEIEQNTLAQEWSRLTGGKVNLQFYSMPALGGEVGVLQKMRTVRPGQKSPLDGGVFSNIGVYELAPKTNALTLIVPYMFRSQEELSYILEKFSPQMKAAIEDQGYVLLGWLNVGWATFYTKEEVRTPEKLKTIKLDAGGFGSQSVSASFKAAGFNTMEVPPDKLAQSMKMPNGIAGAYSVPLLAYASQWYKSLPYAIDAAMCPIMSAFVISKSTWNTIPQEFHQPLMDSVKAAELRLQKAQQKADREYLDLIGASGGFLTKLTPEETAAFESSFRKDVENMVKIPNSVINIDFYHEILDLLDDYRAKAK